MEDIKGMTDRSLRRPPLARITASSRLLWGAIFVAVAPNLLWIWIDKTVWPWDQAWYGKHSVDLFSTLIHAPSEWVPAMLNALGRQAPGIAWAGQFFVPLGLVTDSIDAALLLWIVSAQALALFLMARALQELSDRRPLVVATGLVVMSSAPLLIALSHYYLVEMIQTAAVAWFVFIMARAPAWGRALTLSQLTLATSVAMLAKASSPLFCFGPGLVAVYYLVTLPKNTEPRIRHPVLLAITIVAAIPMSVATIAWYQRNLKAVFAHVSLSARGPVAELYGKSDQMLQSLKFWLAVVGANFFSPFTIVVGGATLAAGIVVALRRHDVGPPKFGMASVVAAVQIAVGLVTFSLSSNRDSRYLLPLLPYFVVLLCWSVTLLNRRLVSAAVMATFALQWGHVHAQALGLIPKADGTASWLNAAASNPGDQKVLDSLVRRTCTDAETGFRWNAVGVQLIWMNAPAVSYAAAKRAAPRRLTCDYDAIAYYDSDADAAWARLMARNVSYYIGIDSSAYAVPATSIDRTLNQLNAPILKRVERSGLFRREAGIAEHNGVLMYKRVDHVTDGRALSDQGKHEEAIAELTRATVLDRANIEAWANLALAYERQGTMQKAIAAGTEARRLNPGHYYVNLGLARSHAQLKEWADARARAEDAALKAPGVVEEVNAVVLAARSSFAAGNAERGCTLLRRARALEATPEIQADITARGCVQ